MSIDTAEKFIQSWLTLARKQFRLFMLEAKLAKQSVIPFFIFFALLILASIMLCTFSLFTLWYCLYHFIGSALFSILIMQAICIIGFIAILKFFLRYFKQLQFTRTRHYLKNKTLKETSHE